MPRVHNCTLMESAPSGSERWKVSEQTRVAVSQLCFREPLSFGAFQETLSGRREALPMVYDPFTTSDPVLLSDSVAFWQATRTNSPTAKVARG